MRIVVEGPDNSGKTTLIDYLARHLRTGEGLHFNVIRGEGPPLDLAEYRQRFVHTEHAQDVIFDRHVAISESVYGPICRAIDYGVQAPDLINRFYTQRPLFVYCAGRGLEQHRATHGRDTPEHLVAIADNHGKILAAYDRWAIKHAHMIYRIGDTHMTAMLRQVQGYVDHHQMEFAL